MIASFFLIPIFFFFWCVCFHFLSPISLSPCLSSIHLGPVLGLHVSEDEERLLVLVFFFLGSDPPQHWGPP